MFRLRMLHKLEQQDTSATFYPKSLDVECRPVTSRHVNIVTHVLFEESYTEDGPLERI